MDRNAIGILILLGLGLAGFWFLIRKTGVPVPTPAPPSPEPHVYGRPLKLQPVGSVAKQYSNKEEWAIDWNEDGLPTKVVISRHATQT